MSHHPERTARNVRPVNQPPSYTYDIFGNKTTMMTYRNESLGQNSGDVTTWLYDEASNCMTNKVYADGKGPAHRYTPDGRLACRIWARGIVTDYSYDNWGSLTNTVYSDNTPTVSLAYDALGRQTEAHDAAGVTTFLYDSFGSVTNETVIGVAGTNTIERFYDAFGRDEGYALNSVRQTTLAYDPATARLLSMQVPDSNTQTLKHYTWTYLAGSDLKSSLVYPNGLTASWTYDAKGQLLQVCNATPTNVISQYDYTYDAAGRRIVCGKSGSAFTQDDTIAYDYNARSELTNAVAAVDSDYRYDYDFDDIGNRETSSERGTNSVYAANQLNQYMAVDGFTPRFDDDGNQTLVKTATGIWSVTYNGENRPILWTQGTSTISMSYDRMGRRVTKNNQRFVYDGYLQIANLEHQTLNIQLQTFVWDPTEKVATRPLVWNSSTFQPFNFLTSYYTHDGNKNVSEIVAEDGDIAVRYEYAPFGSVTIRRGASAVSSPWRFTSEYAEVDIATVYYNYRHYEPAAGRWLNRDPIIEGASKNLCGFIDNSVVSTIDVLGLTSGTSITGAVFYYGDENPYNCHDKSKPRCPCGKDLVFISNSGRDDNGFEAEARKKLKGSDGKNHSFREVGTFDPNSQLAQGECVCSLLVVMHGGASKNGAIAGPMDVDYFENKTDHDISNMFSGVRFCRGCSIELRACHLGKYELLLRRIADSSGCEVKAYVTTVHATGPNLYDCVMGCTLSPDVSVKPAVR